MLFYPPRRTRFYGAMADSQFLDKGRTFQELPGLQIYYVSDKDIWKAFQTVYPVRNYLGDEGMAYDDGSSVTYVNTEVDDGSEIATLMKYFKTADPEDDSQGDLSRRVHYLKCEEGGIEYMCELTEAIEKRGEARGEARGRQAVAFNLASMGMTVDKIAQAVGETAALVQQWLAGETENG